jgi:hypothetical protein
MSETIKKSAHSVCAMCKVRCPIELEVEDGAVKNIWGTPHLLGTFVSAPAAVIIGELTSSVDFLDLRKYIKSSTDEMVRFQNLSVYALAVGDGATYTGCNKPANDEFGKSFFMQMSLSAALLWPVLFVLAWMQSRFSDVEFELIFIDYPVGYLCIFISLYAAAYLIFKRIKDRVPYFREMAEIMAGYRKRAREMKSLADLLPPRRDRI